LRFKDVSNEKGTSLFGPTCIDMCYYSLSVTTGGWVLFSAGTLPGVCGSVRLCVSQNS